MSKWGLDRFRDWWRALDVRWFRLSDAEAHGRIERLLNATCAYDVPALQRLVAFDFRDSDPARDQLMGRLGYVQYAAWISNPGSFPVRPRLQDMQISRLSDRRFQVNFSLEMGDLPDGATFYELDRHYIWLLDFDRAHRLFGRETAYDSSREGVRQIPPLWQEIRPYVLGWNALLEVGSRLVEILARQRALLLTLLLLYLIMVPPPQTAEALRIAAEDHPLGFVYGFILPLFGLTMLMLAVSVAATRLPSRFELAKDRITTLHAYADYVIGLGLSVAPLLIVAGAIRNALPTPSSEAMPLIDSMREAARYLTVVAIVIFLFRAVTAAKVWGASGRRFAAMRSVRNILTVATVASAVAYLLPFPPFTLVPTSVVTWTCLSLCAFGWLTWLSVRTGLPLLILAFAWPIALNYLNLSEHNFVRSRPLEPASGAVLPRADEAFQAWLAQRRAAGSAQAGQFTVFVVAAEGGGMRAGVMTAMVLDELRARYPTFTRHLFAIVGVSGGALGAASFAASLKDGRPPSLASSMVRDGEPASWQAALHADLLSPTVRSMLGPNLLANYVPFVDLSVLDRSRALEDAWADGWRRATGDDRLRLLWFGDVAPAPDEDAPNLILMTTNVADGGPMAVSHLGCFGIPTARDFAPAMDIPLRTAAVMSARFPLITPSGRLPGTALPNAFVDGGYFENSGLTAVGKLIKAIEPSGIVARRNACPGSAAPAMDGARIVVLHIVNGGARQATTETKAGYHLFEAMVPISALYASGDAHGREAQAALADLTGEINQTCRRLTEEAAKARGAKTATTPPPKPCYPVGTLRFELRRSGVPIPLGWLLSRQARAEISRQLENGPNAAAVAKVGDLLGARSSPRRN